MEKPVTSYKEALALVRRRITKSGWLEYSIPDTNKIFKLFQIVCIKKTIMGVETLYIAIGYNRQPSLMPFIQFKNQYSDTNTHVEVWVWKDRFNVLVI
jgi:hypothetical protein